MLSTQRSAVVVGLGAATAVVTAMSGAALGSAAQLTGRAHGTFRVHPTNPDTGTVRNITGGGHLSIGEVRMRGTVTAPGFVIEGSCNVSLRLVTDGGSIKVVGHSKVQSRSGGLICDGHKFRFRFHTTNATGDLAGASYSGVGRFNLKDASNTAYDHGSFTLSLAAR